MKHLDREKNLNQSIVPNHTIAASKYQCRKKKSILGWLIINHFGIRAHSVTPQLHTVICIHECLVSKHALYVYHMQHNISHTYNYCLDGMLAPWQLFMATDNTTFTKGEHVYRTHIQFFMTMYTTGTIKYWKIIITILGLTWGLEVRPTAKPNFYKIKFQLTITFSSLASVQVVLVPYC